ncbi:lipoprotein [Mycoplasma cottewii]|uniref:Lipoprotein n=1 Tax=Mycoplasma cottewii TaxID=51364 RepID=A0ABY5TXD2_9MOLU|nr:lipoprotein [Mycoplasma cottewii]UWD35220.1 lipoprotein [Mycoplasma cottewii]
MKKILSLLSTVSIIATSSSLVVSCGAATREFNQFNKYVEESKNKTLIVYLGAKNNNSSLSFEDGLQEVTDSKSFQDAISKINNGSGQSTNKFISAFHNNLNWEVTKGNDGNPTDNLLKVDVKKEKSKDKESKETKEYWVRTTKIGDNTSKLFQNMTNEVKFESIIYDKIQNTWDGGVRKKILDDYLIPNLAKQIYGINKDTDNKNKEQVTNTVSTLTESVKNLEGPLFMVLRDGMFYGMISGFEVFTNREEKDKSKCIDSITNDKTEKEVRANVFNNFIGYLKESIKEYNIQSIYSAESKSDLIKKTIFAPGWHYSDTQRNDEKKK